MLPDQPWLVICPHCHAPLWIDELEELGKTEAWGDEKGEFNDARTYEKPSLDNYLALIENGVGDPQKERYVRLSAWWAGNDQRRTNAGEIPMSPREAANLMALAHTLDESDANDLVMKAEAMRELGQFDGALALLAQSVDVNIAQAVEIIKGLSEKRDPYVRKMIFE